MRQITSEKAFDGQDFNFKRGKSQNLCYTASVDTAVATTTKKNCSILCLVLLISSKSLDYLLFVPPTPTRYKGNKRIVFFTHIDASNCPKFIFEIHNEKLISFKCWWSVLVSRQGATVFLESLTNGKCFFLLQKTCITLPNILSLNFLLRFLFVFCFSKDFMEHFSV